MAEEKIYTVEFESYGGGDLEGVYKTLEEARDKLRRLHEEYKGCYAFRDNDTLEEMIEGKTVECGGCFRIYERKFGDVDRWNNRKEKFTPGPWKVCHVRDLDMFAVIQVSTKNVIGNFIERHDARLIAAAPEMYEALKDADGHLSLFSDGTSRDISLRIEKILKKARGEE